MNDDVILEFNIRTARDYIDALPSYEAHLRRNQNFYELVKKDAETLNFHKKMAMHSLLNQAWSQGVKRGQSYFVDISPYLIGGGQFIVNMDSSKALADFKSTCDGQTTTTWLTHVKRTVRTFGPIFFSDSYSVESHDLSPIYLAEWILDDWFEIQDLIPLSVESVLDIGCGIGALNILIEQLGVPEKTFTLIDIDEHALGAAHKLLRDNRLKLSSFRDDETYDLIISLRSCCFLYGYEQYEDAFRRQTKPGSTIIVDISIDRLDKTLAFFGSFCSRSISLKKDSANNYRYVFVR